MRKKCGKDKAKDMRDDLRIVAYASIGFVKHIGTLNRKTMASQDAVEIYSRINSDMKLAMPVFIKTKEALLAFISSL